MLAAGETSVTLPCYATTLLTRLPLLYDPEHLYPYPSHDETAAEPTPRAFRMLRIENDALRVLVAPELGGRVYSLFDKRVGKEILYCNPVVKPTRILPVWAYISGGIEFNFPISHSPTSTATVGSSFGCDGDYAWVRVGEREARSGMEWVVEIGLRAGLPILFQRTALRNATRRDQPWMFWSNGAVRSTVRTEFVYPPGPVLMHGDRVWSIDWPHAGLEWERNIRRMVGFFWSQGQGDRFGVFHHDLGAGLLHVADRAQVPGKKLWSYGMSAHRRWGILTADDGNSYAEIQSGPLIDQGEKPMFVAGSERTFNEYWIPMHDRAAMQTWSLPVDPLPPLRDAWLGDAHAPEQVAWERFIAGEGSLPESNVLPGLDVEPALRREMDRGSPLAAEHLATYLAFHRRHEEAVGVLGDATSANAARLLGLVLWKGLKRPAEAVIHLRRGPLDDPVAIVELDNLYTELNETAARCDLLANAPAHRRVIERQADLALTLGRPAEALQLLETTLWPLEHQRYVRTRLWQRARAAMNLPLEPVPEELGEDDLAPFGAYWSE